MKFYRNEMPEVLVLGMNITGLSVIRSLGRRGVPVTGTDYDPRRIGFRSRYCRELLCPHPRYAEDRFLKFLVERARAAKARIALIPTNDEFLLCVSRNRAVLDEHFVHNLPSKETIENLTDKESFHHVSRNHNYPVPRTYFPNEEDTLYEIAEAVEYPCLIKPKYGFSSQELGVKAIRVDSKDDLVPAYSRLAGKSDDLMVQEVVPGDEGQQYSLYSYISRDSGVVAAMTSRKLRQMPVHFGVGTHVVTCDEPAMKELGLALLTELHYTGLSEIEFKKDCRDGHFKIIEVNARPWLQISLGEKCGVDFPWLSYMDTIGEKVPVVESTRNVVKWVCFEPDFYACFGSSGYVRKGVLSTRQWFSSLRGEKEFAYYASDDLRPFLCQLYAFSRRLFSGAAKMLVSMLRKLAPGTSR